MVGASNPFPLIIDALFSRSRLDRILALVVLGVILNFLAFFFITAAIGGDALNGKVVDGHYYLYGFSDGKMKEVSPALFAYSRWHGISLAYTFPPAMLVFLILDARRDARRKNPFDGIHMNIQIASGHTLDQLVDFVLQAAMRRDDNSTTVAALMKDFGLSEEDATLALDRACGGVARAATGSLQNCPDQEKDHIAWLSFQRCLREPSIIAAIYPQFSSSRTRD